MDQELYDLVYLLDQLARAAGAYDGSPLQARVRRALVAGEEQHRGRLIELIPDLAYEYRCDTCHEPNED